MESTSTGSVGVARADVLEQFEPVRTVERDIDNHDVGPVSGDRLQERCGFLGFAAHRQVRLLVDELRQSLPHDRMIVHQKNRRFLAAVTTWYCGIITPPPYSRLLAGNGKQTDSASVRTGSGLPERRRSSSRDSS